MKHPMKHELGEPAVADRAAFQAAPQARRRQQSGASPDRLLSLAAAPTFAIMALLAAVEGGNISDVLCSAAYGASPLSGMASMYVLMSVFHLAPWLRLIANWRRGAYPA
jgi:hypothetical protein